jgi:hypothetical protein
MMRLHTGCRDVDDIVLVVILIVTIITQYATTPEEVEI